MVWTIYESDSIPGTGKIYFFFLHSAKTSSGAHPAFYPMDTAGSFSGGKAVGT
jgi:hypothetical protein